jgi:hypothetical protein
VAWFHAQGVRVLRVLTDNAKVYRVGQHWRAVCAALGLRRRFTKPGCPWTWARRRQVEDACSVGSGVAVVENDLTIGS